MPVNGINLITVSHIQPCLPDTLDLLWKTGGEFAWWEGLLGPGYLTGSGLWRNLGLRESIKVTPSNMSLEEGCEADRCYLRWDEFPPDHGKAAALYRLHHIFGFVQLGWLRVDLHSQVRTDKTGDWVDWC